MRIDSFGPSENYGTWDGTKMKPLPGEPGLKYRVAVVYGNTIIYIGDPDFKENVASLKLAKDHTISGAYHVEMIKVSNKYRKRGLAKALYNIALTILKITLVAGDQQTLGGRRIWVSLFNNPGCEVLGYVRFIDATLDGIDGEQLIDEIMMLGGQYYGRTTGDDPVFLFPVNVNKKELHNALNNSIIKVYDESFKVATGLMARWIGT